MTTSTGYLLDGHVLLWRWFDPQRLPEGVLALLSDEETTIFAISGFTWELSIKHHLGKLPELQPFLNLRPSLAASFGRLDRLMLAEAFFLLRPFPEQLACPLDMGN